MKRFYFIIVGIISFLAASGQQTLQGPSFTLHTPVTGGNYTYEARDNVKLTNGFRYAPQNTGDKFHAMINPYLLFPPETGITGGPGGEVGDDGVVGLTAGGFNVSPSGGANYSVPIQAPPGIAGMTPQLSLIYNSQGGDGMLGPGWSVGGISEISLVKGTKYYDGQNNPVYYESDHCYTLDGNRLIWQKDSTDRIKIFRLENDNFSKILSIQPQNTETYDMYFKVYTKSGLIYTYGYDLNSRQTAQNYQYPIKYLISSIEDLMGNYMQFNYIKNVSEGECYISNIKYALKRYPSYTKYNIINFQYETKDDSLVYHFSIGYGNGAQHNYFKVLHRLKTITCQYTGSANPYRIYNLEYIIRGPNNTHYLNKIQETCSDGSKFNHLVFKYQNIPDYTSYNTNSFTLHHEGDQYFADFDGNGSSEMFVTRDDSVDFYSFTNNNYSYVFSRAIKSNKPKDCLAGDFNGDGKTDLLFWYKENGNYYMDLWVPTNDYNFSIHQKIQIGSNNYETADFVLYPGDFNGDGIADILMRTLSQTPYINIFLGSTNNNFIYDSNYNPGYAYLDWYHELYIGDFDGDGKSDIFSVGKDAYGTDQRALLYYYLGWNTQPLNDSITLNDKITLGDFNGDHRMDLLVCKGRPDYSHWQVYQSTGRGLIKVLDQFQNIIEHFSHSPDSIQMVYKIGDFNGDGHADICRYYTLLFRNYYTYEYDRKYYYLHLYTSNNYGNTLTINEETPNVTYEHDNLNNKNFIYDVNGDGLSDFISPEGISMLQNYGNSINSITNSLGAETKITYSPLSSFASSTSSLPRSVSRFGAPMLLVSKVERDNGSGGYFSTTYSYQGALLHREGKGFLGFENISSFDDQSGLQNDVWYSDLDTTYFCFKKIRTYVRLGVNGSIVNFNENNCSIKNWGLKNIYLYTSESKTYEQEVINAPISIYRYTKTIFSNVDDYGNTLHMETAKGTESWDNLPFKETTSNTYDNIVTNNKWILGRLKTANVVKTAPNTPNITRKSSFTYYDNGFLKTETVEPGNVNAYTKKYNYDTFGNIDSTVITATGIETRITQTFYDHNFSAEPKGRFLTKLINAENHVEERTYDQATGNLLEQKDPNGLTTKYEYDGFNRLTKTTMPNGVVSAAKLRWVNGQTDAPANALYYSWSQSSASSPAVIYYDKLGRELRKVAIGFDGTKIFVDTQYDNKGRVSKVSDPYFEGTTSDSIYYTETLYDGLNRAFEKRHPGSSIVHCNYHCLQTITTTYDNNNNPISNTKIYDVAGNLIESKDANNTSLKYSYYSSGLVANVFISSDSARTNIHKTYDIFGNVQTITDPDMGTVTNTYYPTGELKSQTDAKGTVNYTYDKIGRMKTRTEPEGTTTWVYDSQPNGIGEIGSISGPDDSETYTYDELGRMVNKTEIINGETFVISNTYDIYGRPQKLTYPSGFTVTQKYNQNGYLSKVIRNSDNKVMWEASTMNARGQYEKYILGQTITTEQDYYSESGLLKNITSTNSANQLQNYSYTWDKLGNLTTRSDVKRNKTENFGYDYLNRLCVIYKNGQQIQIQYDRLGNITYKSDVGTYGYDPVKIHAVVSINGNPNTISRVQQAISYTSFDKVDTITQGNNLLQLFYGNDHERRRQVITRNGNLVSSKIYVGGIYEKIQDSLGTSEVHYLSAGDGLFAIYTIKPNGTSETNYVLKDHLGSVQVLVNENGSLKEEYCYDAWGNRCNPDTWELLTGQAAFATDRGFTGHEQLDLFALVNMNGRVYDPTIGRFLSPDPIVQAPDYTQGLNRYSYCMNNPLAFIDPSGHSLISSIVSITVAIVVAAAIIVSAGTTTVPAAIMLEATLAAGAAGGFAGALTEAIMNRTPDAFASVFFGTLFGAFSGVMSYGAGEMFIGEAARSLSCLALVGKALTHGTMEGILTVMQGGRFEQGFYSAAFASITGPLSEGGNMAIRTAAGAVVGGTASEIGGGKFANGAVTGAYTMLFNDGLHDLIENAKLNHYAKEMFPGRIPKNATFELYNAKDGLTVAFVNYPNAPIKVYIPREFWNAKDDRLLIDCIDHELYHVDDYASGRAYEYYKKYGESATLNILDYKAYKGNQWYNTHMRQNGIDYSDKVNFYEKKLPEGWWKIK